MIQLYHGDCLFEKEEWRPIKGYEGFYEVSSFGRIKSLPYTVNNGRLLRERKYKEKILTGYIDAHGYAYIKLAKRDGRQKTAKIHRLVAKAFIPNPDNLPQINHKDENKRNNRVDNLEWCTARYNLNYGSRSKKYMRKVSMIDLETNKVIKVFDSMKDVEKELKIGHSKVSCVCHGKRNSAGGYGWRFADGN